MSLSAASAGFMLGLLINPEDGGSGFLQKRQAVSELNSVKTQKAIFFSRPLHFLIFDVY
jgi:hypothetical protein